MHRNVAAAFFIVASTVSSSAGELGEPRYFVKAWLQMADRSFEHSTGWCDGKDDCFMPIGEHMIQLRNMSASFYSLSFWNGPSQQDACCVTRTGFPTLRLWSGRPRVVPLYYTPRISGDPGQIPFGKLVIAVEYLG
ncbi:hypothetical protein C7U60_12110 [Mesorhizobium plurifarium]|uniref:hypothetical protein n=1 Tax=Sinorhizobium arboris TaxID=76745 RepID=UPI0004899EBD|nr:hypothetical protein [Sinorhizobium arboris]PST21996.1 hypothetical protein C7U60_12110 [Mesorhizobium plurifarium]